MNTQKLCTNSIHAGSLILVNSSYAIRHENTEPLIAANAAYPSVLLRHDAASALQSAIKSINGNGEIVPVSGYRCAKEQAEIYSSSLKENGKDFTQSFVALPYHSEHQTALAIDLAQNMDNIDFIRPHFPYSGICDEFRKVSAFYGFIERYPEKKEHITGIAHEPWHFRYVGRPHSELIAQAGFTLEEYIEFVKQYPYDKKHLTVKANGNAYEIFYIAENEISEAEFMLENNYQLSGNNTDGFIAALWRCCE